MADFPILGGVPPPEVEAAMAGARRSARVALINMPFVMADRPSIQCGLLKASLVRHGYPAEVHYLNLEHAAEFGHAFYEGVAHLRTDQLLGEWLFAVAAFGAHADDEAYRRACPAVEATCRDLKLEFEHLCRYRHEVFPAWIERWAEAVDWGAYRAVGFTSTFEQNTASFALARAIKAHYPGVVTLFGGANFDGPMGKVYAARLPYIDHVVVGEGDRVLPELLDRLLEDGLAAGVRGVVSRLDGEVVDGGPAAPVHDLDELPDPDYDEYFETLFRLGRERVLGDRPPLLLFETGRGCWWGEKQHCTFCGLNANGMKFRSKSPERAHAQLRRLSQRYRIVNFEAVDNIMDTRYIEALCDPLIQDRCDYQIFYEVKANLRPAQLRTMARAGILSVQPGIESLNTHVLALMRKGVTMLRNVRFLKWGYYYGMRIGWNIIAGFPGETEEDYEAQLRIVPLLRHLPPPTGVGRIWLERFSPYFFDDSFPVHDIRPREAYRFVYPEADFDLAQIAYFFDYEMDGVVPEELLLRLREEVDAWREAWQRDPRPVLVYQRAPDWIQIIDRRGDVPQVHAFQRLESLVYELCGESEQTVRTLTEQIARREGSGALGRDQVQEALDAFCDHGLMLTENDRYLSLALPVNPNW